MEREIAVTRKVDLDLSPAEVWRLIADGDRWADWMVDAAEVEVVPGGTGRISDAGEQREVQVDSVDDGERVSFRWWPTGRRDDASAVELVVLPALHGTVLHVVETFPAAGATVAIAAARAWTARAGRTRLCTHRVLAAAA